MPRPRTLLIAVVALVAVAVLWQKNSPRSNPQPVTAGQSSPSLPGPATASKATPTDDRGKASAASGTDARATSPSPGAPAPDAATSTGKTEPNPPVRLDVRAHPSAHVGDRFTITIDAEAFGGIRNLSFGVTYDRQILEFMSSSPGSFVQQASAPATFSAEDTSAGNVFVSMDIENGGVVAAAGTVVVIEFTALRAGTSPITPTEVSFLESGRSIRSTAAAVRPASVTIE